MTPPIGSSRRRERGSALTATVSVVAGLLIIAAVVFTLYYYLTPPPATAGQVLSLDVLPIHNTAGGGVVAGGVSGRSETFNEVIVLANITLKNTAKVPVSLFDIDSDLYAPDGTIYQDGAESQKNFHRVFLAYPKLQPKKRTPLLRDTVIQPGGQVSGQLLFHYPVPLQQWQSRKALHIVFSWGHQGNLILKLSGKATSTGWQH